MNYFLGSYIDLIQTIGFISICVYKTYFRQQEG